MFQKPAVAAQPAAPSAAPAAEQKTLGPPVVKLSKGIMTHDLSKGGVTTEIKFRPITADVLIKYKKLPFSIRTAPDGTREVDTDFALAARYISELTDIDESLLGQLSIADFTKCLNALGGLLADADAGN